MSVIDAIRQTSSDTTRTPQPPKIIFKYFKYLDDYVQPLFKWAKVAKVGDRFFFLKNT